MSNDFLETMAARRSSSSVTEQAPDDDELARLLAAVVPVADHKGLRPWRLVVHRGDERLRVGDALARGDLGKRHEQDPKAVAKLRKKTTRAPLLLAVIAERRSSSLPKWEQEAVASGAAHLLELALFAAGWGVMWRTGSGTDTKAVRRLYGLHKRDRLLGWLYVGGIKPGSSSKAKKRPDPDEFLTRLPQE
ncbi:nitroreductase family protein [Arthrobacter castelli]|uniref:nitroreductase family protein n=1 Tax=Arthrobacter castelli TaxID=271431 RepID=UPI0003F59B2D|nr:nitroreductase family protein [Arthrobacter castelli]